MNIFYLHHNPVIASQWHMDKHCVKMLLEYSQILSTAHHVLGTDLDCDLLYRKTHVNHPSSIWARQSSQNYLWLYNLFCAVCDEYTFRYGKIHKTDTKLRELLKTFPLNISDGSFTQPPQAMPDDCKCNDSILAYRKYYICHKSHIAKWKKREIPFWFKNNATIDM